MFGEVAAFYNYTTERALVSSYSHKSPLKLETTDQIDSGLRTTLKPLERIEKLTELEQPSFFPA